MKKTIFGKSYQFTCDKEFDGLLAESLELYIDADGSAVDVEIHIGQKLPDHHALSVNPKLHHKFKNGMLTAYGNAEISWIRSEAGVIKAFLVLKKPPKFKGQIIKLLSMEYSREVEIFEQVLHELVLIPSVYFFKDLALVHAAAVAIGDSAILLAGTGGVGKSSALLALRHEDNSGFISDDIAVISADGKIFANMAWPKIYGYNCIGSQLKHELLVGRGLVDRLHFELKNKLNPAKVRRKLKPDQLYRQVQATPKDISRLYYMVREDVPEITIKELAVDVAAGMSGAVMNTEYAMFHNHLFWEEYNALALGQAPMLAMKAVESNWQAVYTSCFSSIQRFKVSIPLEIDHVFYQQRIKGIVTENLR